ncbi:MAG: sigma-54 dependent transcriptional regulator [Rhodothermales bacterium]
MDRESVQERFGIVGTSAAIRHVIDQMRLVARTEVNVLIQGESGVGKEVIAKAIHEMGTRRHKALVIVNCGAIPEGLIESELFGAEKGAYTGAVDRRSGHFEEADGGSIFLDEIGEMPLAAQVRLLRVLETGEFSRVGSSTILKSDARVIAATNKELGKEVQAGRFREDLYYRISTVIIQIPPLRDRQEDILPIFESYLHQFAQKYNSPMRRLDDAARQMLVRYRWPGNVRELRNLAEQVIVLLKRDVVGVEDLRTFLRGVTASGASSEMVPSVRPGGWKEGEGDDRGRELIYRALLELRLEIRDLKEHIVRMSPGVRVPKGSDAMESNDYERSGSPFVIVRENAGEDAFSTLVEEVPYELEPTSVPGRPLLGAGSPPPRDYDDIEPEEEDAEPVFPTLESAEQQLIADALKYYKGNRRQTARALGISERTLYRKLKEIDEEA